MAKKTEFNETAKPAPESNDPEYTFRFSQQYAEILGHYEAHIPDKNGGYVKIKYTDMTPNPATSESRWADLRVVGHCRESQMRHRRFSNEHVIAKRLAWNQ